jgi:peptidoglycan hydrolase-like protein with peptidoglycan-binding domain
MSALKKMAVGALMASMLVPALSFAQTTTSTSSIQTLLEQIRALQTQMQTLQQQQQVVLGQLVTTLGQGSKGENVKILQQLLAQDSSIYPEGLISGFYGRLTAEAVKRFQKKHGIEQAGNVGPKTLKKLNELFSKMASSSNRGHGKNNDDDGDEDSKPGVGKVIVCHKGKETIHVGAPALQAHINHGDVVGACSGSTGATTPDTTAPSISNPSVSSIASTTATIAWSTGTELATGKVYYATTSPINLGTALTVGTTTLSTSHSFGLSGLSTSTTYYYVLESKDAANNTATTSSTSFTTTI